MIVIHRTELSHHGIKGQKWGVTNGPPYPLDTGTHKRVLDNVKDKIRETKNSIDKKTSSFDKKKALKIGAVAVGIGIAAIGGYALYKSGALKTLVKTGKDAIGNVDLDIDAPKPESLKVPSIEGLKVSSAIKKNLGKTFDELKSDSMIKSINQGNKLTNSGNCTNTTAVYILNSLFGGNFQAKALDQGRNGIGADIYKDLFKNINEIKTNNNPDNVYDGYKLGKKIFDQIPNGSTGILLTAIPGKGRHAVNYEKSIDGALSLVEGKYGIVFQGNNLSQNIIDSYGYVQRILDFSDAGIADGATLSTIKKFAR